MTNVTIVDQPEVNPNPVSPSMVKNVIIGAVVGIVISLGYLLLTYLLDTKIKNGEQAEQYLGVPLLGIVPFFEVITMAFIDLMKAKAKQDKQTIVLPESKDKRTLIAAAKVLEEGTADLIMVGKEEKIMDGAGWLEVDLTGLKVVDPDTDPKFDHYAETLFELRKHKGMTKEKAEEILRTDYITYGVMMVKEKDADGLVAGACHATADTLRPALQILKTAPGTELVSGFFIMDVPNCEYGANGTFLFADCGLNQDPNSEELAAIADSSAKSFRALVGEKPVIAMLSHSTKGSASMPR